MCYRYDNSDNPEGDFYASVYDNGLTKVMLMVIWTTVQTAGNFIIYTLALTLKNLRVCVFWNGSKLANFEAKNSSN